MQLIAYDLSLCRAARILWRWRWAADRWGQAHVSVTQSHSDLRQRIPGVWRGERKKSRRVLVSISSNWCAIRGAIKIRSDLWNEVEWKYGLYIHTVIWCSRSFTYCISWEFKEIAKPLTIKQAYKFLVTPPVMHTNSSIQPKGILFTLLAWLHKDKIENCRHSEI